MLRAHEAFLRGEADPVGVRPQVRESWRRSMASGLDPEAGRAPVDLVDDDLRAYRAAHPLAPVMELIRRLLTDTATEAGHLVAVADADGRLLWVEGDPRLRAKAERMHFVEGARWGESAAGTNAPALALVLDQPAQVYAGEHFTRIVQAWSCSAVPVHDPLDGHVLGAIDLTGGDQVASPHAMALVRATAAAVEAELELRALRAGAAAHDAELGGRLDVLGRDHAVLSLGGRQLRLSQRHGELLLLLVLHPEGLTAEQLAVELHEREASPVTVRAEVSRLRRLLGEQALGSQPYRLLAPLGTDVDELRQRLRRGSARRALALYAGPVLPRSLAPGIVDLRLRVEAEVRQVVLRSGSADLALWLAEHEAHRDDVEVWQAALRRLPPGSRRRAVVEANLRRLSAQSSVLPRQRTTIVVRTP